VKIRFDLQGRFQARLERIPADLEQTKLDEMGIVELGVQQHVAAINETRRQMYQRDL
jgi:hypothetical protein